MQNEGIQSTRVKLGYQKGQGKLQDNVDLVILTNKLFDYNTCAYCQHRRCMSIDLDIPEINRYNLKVIKLFQDKMKVWTNTPTK